MDVCTFGLIVQLNFIWVLHLALLLFIYKGQHSKVPRCFVGIVLVSEHDKHAFIHSFIIDKMPHPIIISFVG